MHPFVVLAIVDYTEVLATSSSQVLAARWNNLRDKSFQAVCVPLRVCVCDIWADSYCMETWNAQSLKVGKVTGIFEMSEETS